MQLKSLVAEEEQNCGSSQDLKCRCHFFKDIKLINVNVMMLMDWTNFLDDWEPRELLILWISQRGSCLFNCA